MVITITAFTAMCLAFNTQQDARVGKGIKPKSRFWTGSSCVRGHRGVILVMGSRQHAKVLARNRVARDARS